MNSLEMALSYLRQAAERLTHAEEALKGGNYPFVVRQSQEAVELSLKAALRLVGVEPPKWHDVGPLLRRERDRFPPDFQGGIDLLASFSRRLRREREPSLYGDEETGLPPDELYTRLDAEESLAMARQVYQACRGLMKK